MDRWPDGLAILAGILYQLVKGRPSTLWEGAETFVWLLCVICAIHVVKAIVEVWREITRQPTSREVESLILFPDASKRKTVVVEPRPRGYRAALIGVMVLSLVLLWLPAYLVHSAAVASLRTYIYLVPTAELMECQKRAFFVKMLGPETLYNVTIVLKDNKSGDTHTETYPEVDPGRTSDMYFWFAPASRWDEDYSATMTSRESHSDSVQDIILRSVKAQTQIATQIVLDNDKIAAKCRDPLLPASYSLAIGENRNCARLMKLIGDVPTKLDVYSYQRPDGNLTIRRIRTLPPPSELDEGSDDRHITEYQRQLIEPTLSNHRKSRILIYFFGGPKTKAYAEEFYRMFRTQHWLVSPPSQAPVGDERMIDVQISVNQQENWNKSNPKAHDLLEAFGKAGIKQRRNLTLDPNVPDSWIVLWIGPRSPNDVKPNQCLPAEMRPVAGQHHTCEMIAATDGDCPAPLK